MSTPLVADMVPPPTLLLDSVYLGWVGLLVLPGIVTAAVFAGRALRRRGRGKGAAIAVGIAVFVVLDLVAYFVGITLMLDAKRELRREMLERREQAIAPGPSGQAP
ncbi:hypothetical protein [Nannocystis sp. SCPEA4]|uniref:hypothetical protein n=1 Tax=Nannocystis sp. SCPEA4 TaxID=2996787 RepID=UPI0022702007|nr:hypothetical protein [Nannocystis sp. SCPEA4]MCY1055713.1 hypothetical protein [Nannocystis sp. SCPEA4]